MVEAGALVKELQEMRDDGHLSDALLRYAVRAIEPSDERFSWVGVYRQNDGADEIWLHNYIGAGTDNAKVPFGAGVMGKAAADKENKNVGDLTTVEDAIVSAEDAMSEMVVLIRAGDDVFGLFNLESEESDAFTAEDEANVQLIADKLAEQIRAERR